MISKETTRRLYMAFKSDKYIEHLQNKMSDSMAYHSMPFDGSTPESVKIYQEMIKLYIKSEYPFLAQDTDQKSDLITAMGWALTAQHEHKILSTKRKSNWGVLEDIDNRLSLYIIYQRYWLDNTEWRTESPFDTYFQYGFLLISDANPVLGFTHWLYQKGYEHMLSDYEFLDTIRYFDESGKKDEPSLIDHIRTQGMVSTYKHEQPSTLL